MLVFQPNCLLSSQIVLPTFQRLARNTSGHLTAKQFQDLFEVLDGRGARPQQRPAMSYVQHPLLRKIQILVSNKCFDYVGDFVAAVNVLLVSVSSLLFLIRKQGMDLRAETDSLVLWGDYNRCYTLAHGTGTSWPFPSAFYPFDPATPPPRK